MILANSLVQDQVGRIIRAWSESKLFDILIIFLYESFKEVNFEKVSADDKKWKIIQHAMC